MALGQQVVFDAGVTGPEGHALSRPAVLEGEATARAVKLASFVGVPLYVVHVMSTDALEEVRDWVGCPASRSMEWLCLCMSRPRDICVPVTLPLPRSVPLNTVTHCILAPGGGRCCSRRLHVHVSGASA